MNEDEFIVNKDLVNKVITKLFKGKNNNIKKYKNYYFHHSFDLSNIEVTQFVNNDTEISNLYEQYIKNVYQFLENYEKKDDTYKKNNKFVSKVKGD